MFNWLCQLELQVAIFYSPNHLFIDGGIPTNTLILFAKLTYN